MKVLLMNKKEKLFLNKIFELNILIINNLDKINIDNLLLLYTRFEDELKEEIENTKLKTPVSIWKKFSTMSEEDIRKEFNDIEKYPDLDSIKLAVKGFIEMKKVSRVKTRETLIKHIINTYKRGEFITKIGMKEEKNEPKK